MCPIEDHSRKPVDVHVACVNHPIIKTVPHRLSSCTNQEYRMNMNQVKEEHVFVEWTRMLNLREESSTVLDAMQYLQIS